MKSVTNENLQVNVFSIVPRNDQWSKNVNEVNKVLLNLCEDANIPFISHTAIDAKKIINNRGYMEVINKGSRNFKENFVKYLKVFSS